MNALALESRLATGATAAAPLPAQPAPAPTPAAQSEEQRLAQAGDVAGAQALMQARPDRIDAVLGAFAQARPGLVPDLIASGGEALRAHAQQQQAAAPPAEEPSLENRIWGGLRALGGGLEAVAGGALILTPEPTTLTKIGGGVLAVHGADNFQAGVRQLWTGQTEESLTQQGAETAATALGIDPETARWIGVGVDVGVGLVGAGVASLGRLGQASRMVWDDIRPTQPVHPGTAVPQSFELATDGARFWVHGNGTKHLAEKANSLLARGHPPELVNLASQVQLRSLQSAVDAAQRQGIVFDQVTRIGGWELIFSAPRAGAALPVIKHALPLS